MTGEIETLRVEVQEARDRGRLPGVQHAISGWNPGAFEARELAPDVAARAGVGKLIDEAIHDALQQEAYVVMRLAQHIEATGDERGILVEERYVTAPLAGLPREGETGLTTIVEKRIRLSHLVPARHLARQVVDHFEDVTE